MRLPWKITAPIDRIPDRYYNKCMARQVTAAVIQKDGKYLIAKRKPGGSLGNKWEFPGGKVEPGESPEEGLARELYEEFEIRVKVDAFICSCLFSNNTTEYELMAYHVEYLGGDFILHEHTEIQWIKDSEFGQYDFAVSDQAVVKHLFG